MKKIISALTSIALLAGVAAMPVAAEETYALGDVTMDGKVDILDVIDIMIEYTVSLYDGNYLTEEQFLLADVTQDGIVSSRDIVFAMQYYGYCLTASDPVSSDEFFSTGGYFNPEEHAVNADFSVGLHQTEDGEYEYTVYEVDWNEVE